MCIYHGLPMREDTGGHIHTCDSVLCVCERALMILRVSFVTFPLAKAEVLFLLDFVCPWAIYLKNRLMDSNETFENVWHRN